MLRELIEGASLLAIVAGGAGLVVLFGRDPRADEHDLTDYHQPAEPAPVRANRPGLAPARRNWPLVDVDERPAGLRLRPGARAALDVLPPAGDLTMSVPLYAECVVAVVASRYGDSPQERAARMLREIADEQRHLVVTR